MLSEQEINLDEDDLRTSLAEVRSKHLKSVARARMCMGLSVVTIAALSVIVLALAIRVQKAGKNANDNDGECSNPSRISQRFGVPLVDDMNTERVLVGLKGLVGVAAANENTRAVGAGYNASVDFIENQLNSQVPGKFDIIKQIFEVKTFITLADPTFSITLGTGGIRSLGYKTDFTMLSYSGSGDVTATVELVPNEGCSTDDFDNFTPGNIALIRRGDCPFATKVADAKKAAAVIVVNKPGQGLFRGTIGTLAPFPVFGVANELLKVLDGASVHMTARTQDRRETTLNMCAYSKKGDAKNAIVVGTHLDSVPAGPGLNDNGSGSSANLALATLFGQLDVNYANQVRFCWWAAEEIGLLGSYEYVRVLNSTNELDSVALNLNFDMLGSPNYIRGIYNASSGPANVVTGSLKLQKMFESFFNRVTLPFKLTPFNGRSDYGPFIEVGIPAGGLDTGAEVIKTVEERAIFGGFAKTAYDPCYHQDCDTLDNVNLDILLSNTQAAGYVIDNLARRSDLRTWLQTKER